MLNFARAVKNKIQNHVEKPPLDTVSCMQFSPGVTGDAVVNEYLAAGDWTNTALLWYILPENVNELKAECNHHRNIDPNSAILDLDWHKNGKQIFMCSTDGTASLWDLQSMGSMQVAKHDAPIKSIHYLEEHNYKCAMTTSWDRTVKFWDLRTPTPTFTIPLKANIFAADMKYPMALFATSDNKVSIYNLEKSPSLYVEMDSPIYNANTTAITIFKDSLNKPTGYMIGSDNGHAAFFHLKPEDKHKNVKFKCHRRQSVELGIYNETYAVNEVVDHPTLMNVFVSIGSDHHYSIWEKGGPKCILNSSKHSKSLSSIAINSLGTKMAYALGYDWNKGHAFSDSHCTKDKTKIVLRNWTENMCPDMSGS